MMKQAESYIPDFHRRICHGFIPYIQRPNQKEYRKMTFSQIPTYNQIDQYMDFDHLELDCILAKDS